jgi:FkbM family methyltransferase
MREVAQLLEAGLRLVEPHTANLQWLHAHLNDEESRDILASVLAFRALGHRRVKLPFNQPEYWSAAEKLERMAEGRETIDPNFLGWRLPKLDLREIGYPIEMFCRPEGVVIQLVFQQYRCATPHGVIEAAPGDVVVDAGGCWGDTALYFAHKIGEGGKVLSFEFLPDNLMVYERNLALNPELAERIAIVKQPVWSCCDAELFIGRNGPGTTVMPVRQNEDDQTARTTTVDRLLELPDASKIDFIKMDIEGAELAALRGAEYVMRRFRPKLAITVYHSLADFWEIPQFIDALGLGYRFYLRHFTTHAEETVLFAQCA